MSSSPAKANYNKILQHNADAALGKHTYTMAVNEFADMTLGEFTTRMNGFNAAKAAHRSRSAAPLFNVSAPPPTSIDWRTKNAVTPVQNQGQCGSCWAFSAVGAIEGANAIKTGKMVPLSEQQLLDCSDSFGNMGCMGGFMDASFKYVIANKGITSDAAYPYVQSAGTCKTDVPVAAISSFVDVAAADESSLWYAVSLGPVASAVEADQQGFQFYSSGIFSGQCGTQINHSVLVVGYGTEAGVDFWIVKNFWGVSWGEAGYIRLVRGQNQCGIAELASYPVV